MTTPNDTAKLDRATQNTDRELWREPHPDPPGDYYANSIHVTAQGGIGIKVGGTVVVKTLAQWHALVVEPDGQLRANLSNDAIQSLLDTTKEWKGKAERLEAELAEARKWIQHLEQAANLSTDAYIALEQRCDQARKELAEAQGTVEQSIFRGNECIRLGREVVAATCCREDAMSTQPQRPAPEGEPSYLKALRKMEGAWAVNLAAHINRLTAENAALLKDKERLEFAMKHLAIIRPPCVEKMMRGGTVQIFNTREDIDAALSPQTAQPDPDEHAGGVNQVIIDRDGQRTRFYTEADPPKETK